MKTIRLIAIILFVVLITAFGIWVIQYVFPKRMILARVSAISIPVNKPLYFSDSTKSASSWQWLFGDGFSATSKKGAHVYKRPGRYLIKLIVDYELTQMMEVNITDLPMVTDNTNEIISIDGPLSGFQGEYLLFTADGNDSHWRWNMGENAGVDSRDSKVMYKYDRPGTYNIRLMSESSKYPALFVVKILPQFRGRDADDESGAMDEINKDIRKRLQAIANGRDFNENYYYLVNKYLCQNEHVPVIVDGKKANDFFSYCMGLRLDAGTVIGAVASDRRVSSDTTQCVRNIRVKQH